MKFKGSITVFFSLVLAVVVSLIGGLLLSAKISAGRVQIANGVDMSLFSAMAKYDRQLFEEYHLLYIDGGYGTGTLQLGKALDEIESDLSYAITPNKEKEWLGGKNFLQLEVLSGSIIGYTLATDCNGSVFWEQVISYMEDTLSLQGISLLSQNLEEVQSYLSDAETIHKKMEEKGTVEEYEEVKKEAATQQEDISKNGDVEEPLSLEMQREAVRAKDVLDGIILMKKNPILHLIIPDESSLSDWSADGGDLYRNRMIKSGMGYLELVREQKTIYDDLLFQEYIIQNINSYTNNYHETGPAYGVEWILFEELSDMENLERMINRLMAMREAVNVACLYSDSSRMSEIRLMASALATVLGVPGAEFIIEGALALAWAYVESIVDVHMLMKGNEVALIKNHDSWQVEFGEILFAIQDPGSFGENTNGMSYEDYLRTFLAMQTRENNIKGCLEVIEESMKEIPGKETFGMDLAIDSLEVAFEIKVENYLDYSITEKRSYRTL